MAPKVTAPPAPAPRHSMPAPHPAGGIAGLVIAGTYIVGFVAMAAYLVPAGFVSTVADPAGSLAFLLDHQSALYVWYAVLYLVGGAALVPLVLGVHQRIKHSDEAWAVPASAFGLIWAGLLLASGMVALLGQRAVIDLAVSEPELAQSTWLSVGVVQDALGGGIELVGALWVLLVSVTALRSQTFGRGLAWLGLLIGVAGLATVVPGLAEAATSAFGLGLIVWFAWAGIVLLRR